MAHAFHINPSNQAGEEVDEIENVEPRISPGSCRLCVFVVALQRAVAAQFADLHMIDEAMGDSSAGNRVKGSIPADGAGDGALPSQTSVHVV